MLVIVHGSCGSRPIGVFALALGMGQDLGLATAGAVGYYVVVLCGMLLAVTLAVYPVVGLFGRASLRAFSAPPRPPRR